MFQSGISSNERMANWCCDSGWKRTRRSRSAWSAVVLAPLELAVLLQPGDDALLRLLLGEARELAHLLVHAAVEADDRQRRQAVVASDLKVDRVVAGRDLQRARAELGLDARVGDDRDAALDDRDDDLLADRVAVALVVRMDGDGDVGEDRGRPDGRDRDRSAPVDERVPGVRERVVHLLVDDLEVGDRRLVERAPVDDPVRAVDPPLLPEVDEERHDCLDVLVVHREALARVVERGAEAAELAHDRAPRLLEVAPDALDELLAAELLARGALERELLLDDVLCGDPRVVVARLPERVVALHPVPADEEVLDRAVERVPHVERARDVRRRHGDDVRLVAPLARAGAVEPFRLPALLPALLDAFRSVERVHGGHSTVAPAPLRRRAATRVVGGWGALARGASGQTAVAVGQPGRPQGARPAQSKSSSSSRKLRRRFFRGGSCRPAGCGWPR
jgi:hypothetical protein